MCILVQVNTYHYCCHTQRVNVPSVNPSCAKRVLGRMYLMNEWCPRCRWTGFLVPFEYTEFADGVPCEGITGKVTRTVKFSPDAFKRPVSKEAMWEGRTVIARNRMLDMQNEQLAANYARIRADELRQGVPEGDRTYWMEGYEQDLPDENLCRELMVNVSPHEAPEEENCTVCQYPMNTNTPDAGHRCASGELIVKLPCNHYFGQNCVGEWLGHKVDLTPTCPSCVREFKIMYQIPYDSHEMFWAPGGWVEQWDVDFAEDVDIRRLYYKLMLFYYVKIVAVGMFCAPTPFFSLRWAGSWTNMWFLTFGAAFFWHSFIHLPQVRPIQSPRERIIQNRFALVSVVANTLEFLYANAIGASEHSIWWQICSTGGFMGLVYYYIQPIFGLPVEHGEESRWNATLLWMRRAGWLPNESRRWAVAAFFTQLFY